MVWQVVTKSATAAGKAGAKGTAAVGKAGAKGAAALGKAAGRAGAKGAGQAGKAGAKGAAKGAGQAGKAGAKGAGKAGKGLDPRDLAQARKAARAGKGGGSGSGSGGRGPLGKGGKPKGWAGRALRAANGQGGPGGRGLSGLGGGGAGEGSEGVGDSAAEASDALRQFIRNRLRRKRGPLKKTRSRLNRVCLALLTMLVVIPFLMGLYGADASSDQAEAIMAMQCSGAPVELMSEETEIPPEAVAAYCSAAVAWQINWSVLAAIGKKECDHGRNRLPGCDPGPPLTINEAGARGPMQFLGSTWRSSAGTMQLDVSGPPIPKGEESAGYATDGDDDGEADPWSWRDATHAAARYLLAHDYNDDPRQAIYAYNNSWDYVDDVQSIAAELEGKVTSLIDREGLEGGGNGGGLALGCPTSPAGSTAKVPASHNTVANQQMANTLISCFGRNGHNVGCYDPRYDAAGNEGPYEHPRGRACDFMMTDGKAAGGNDRARGEAMAMFAAAHAKELKIIYVIWYGRSWNPSDGNIPWNRWGNYSCDGSASDCHYNHVHVSVHLQPGDPPLAQCPPRRCTE